MERYISSCCIFVTCFLFVIYYIGTVQHSHLNISYIFQMQHLRNKTITFVESKSNVCLNLTIVSYLKLRQPFAWQSIIPDKSFVYSAFIDNRNKQRLIKLVTIININEDANYDIYCHIWIKNSTFPVVVNAQAEPRFGGRTK